MTLDADPAVDALIDVLPAVLLFGVGITLVVAPLTTTLMGSIPVGNAGIGSAINNAISRVGQPLLGAVIFVASPRRSTRALVSWLRISTRRRPPCGWPSSR